MLKAVTVGLLGLGTVGGGALAVLRRNADEISRRAGREIRVVRAAVRNIAPHQAAADAAGVALTAEPFAVADDPAIDIVVELMGGVDIAREAVWRAIDNGKHVVTANKALLALHGNAIFEHAQRRGVMVAFEAAVGGGIPIIKALREGLAGNRIQWLAGIINGTCNYILTRMDEAGADFGEVLGEAQARGYAEAQPEFDIEGTDAAHKLSLLASIAFGIPLQFSRVHVQGITAIALEDIAHARELGYRIKHLGLARRGADGIELRVHPTLIPQRRLLANVDGVMNAILVQADAVGPTLYYGAGAGAEPTASSVVADLVDVARAISADQRNRVPPLGFQPEALAALPILPMEQIKTAYYLRLTARNRPGVLASVARIFGDSQISIDTVLQKGYAADGNGVAEKDNANIIMLTQKTQEGRMNQALEKLAALESVSGDIVRIRMESLISA